MNFYLLLSETVVELLLHQLWLWTEIIRQSIGWGVEDTHGKYSQTNGYVMLFILHVLYLCIGRYIYKPILTLI